MQRSEERKKTRLKEWDYSSEGYYFVTICVKDRLCVFGEVKDDEMFLNGLGNIVKKCWEEIPGHFDGVELDEFIVMPNHVHGIVIVKENDSVAVGNRYICSLQKTNRNTMLLSKVLGAFKAAVTRDQNRISSEHFAWQKSFHDRIVRNQKELEKIQHYIIFNASKWREDDFFVE
jgi:REP element-mobilizing transposase RayT